MGKLMGLTLAFVMINVFLAMWGVIDIAENPFITFIGNPSLGALMNIFSLEGISVLFGIGAAVSLIAGLLSRNDTLLFAGVAVGFMSYSLMLLQSTASVPVIFKVFLISPLMIMYWFCALDWLRGKD